MAFGDLIRRRRLVDIGGRRYVCRPPSAATVYLTLHAYGQHAEVARRTLRVDPSTQPATNDEAREILSAAMLDEPEHLPEILATCVEPAPPQADCRAALAGVLDLFDVLRVGQSIADDLSKPKATASDESIEDAPTRMAVQVAKRFHLSPLEVANDWPYEAVLTVQDIGAAGKGPKLTPDTLAPGTYGGRVKKRPLPN